MSKKYIYIYFSINKVNRMTFPFYFLNGKQKNYNVQQAESIKFLGVL